MDWRNSPRLESFSLSELNVPEGNSARFPKVPFEIHSDAYLAELRKLLIKSKGTSYEGTLQKFIDLKNRERMEIAASKSPSKSPSTRSLALPANSRLTGDNAVATPLSRISSPERTDLNSSQLSVQSMPVPTKLDISGLESTMFVDHFENLRCSIHSKDKKKWINDMAQPLDRNTWKGPVAETPNISNNGSQLSFGGVYRLSTNHLGRQRPPAWQPNESLRLNKDPVTSTASRSPSPGPNRQHPGKSASINGGSTIAVSLSEFDEWIKKNKDWKATVTAKLNERIVQRQQQDKLQSNPRVLSKSEQLAENSNRRILEASTQQQVQGTQYREPLSLSNVFDRLQLRNRIREGSPLRCSTPPLPQNLFVFEPSISNRSKKLVARRRRRALSAGSKKEQDIGIVQSIGLHQHQISVNRHTIRSQSPNRYNNMTSTANAAGASVVAQTDDLGRAERMLEDELDAVSEPGGERRKLSMRSVASANSGITNSIVGNNDMPQRGRSRSRSNSNQESPSRRYSLTRSQSYDAIRGRSRSPIKKVKQWVLKEEKSQSESKPFHPVLLATETKKIMARQHEDFNERVNKSVENFIVRKAVAERAYEPGPMHYLTSGAPPVIASSPLRGSAHRSSQQSPGGGRSGYTWSKERRDASTSLVPWNQIEDPARGIAASRILAKSESQSLKLLARANSTASLFSGGENVNGNPIANE